MAIPLLAWGVGTGLTALGQWLASRNSANAADKAAEAQAAAATYGSDLAYQAQRENTQLQLGALEQQQMNQQPWLNFGKSALGDLSNLTLANGELMQGFQAPAPFDPGSVAMDPGFDFRMREGQRAIERAAAARGGALGGAAMRGAARYGQELASDEYGKAYQRKAGEYDRNFSNAFNVFQANDTNRFNRLASLAGIGQTAALQMGQAQQSYANNVGQAAMATAAQRGDLATQAANARASGYVGAANAYGQVPRTIASSFGQLFGSR